MSSDTRFSPKLRDTVMVLATLRAVAASGNPAIRLLGNVRCDDIIRSVDELMPLDEYWPGQTGTIKPTQIYMRQDWRDGQPADIVLMGVLTCAMHWERDATIAGPLLAGELADAVYHCLTGRDLQTDQTPQEISDDAEPA